jgi:hypothetical protein
MISFGQLLILFLLMLLLFGDIRKVFNKIIVFFVNLKTVVTKIKKNDKNKNKSE